MELALQNLERHSMLFVGSKIVLTPENPGPILIDIDSLTKEEAYQVLYNIRMGVLTSKAVSYTHLTLPTNREV